MQIIELVQGSEQWHAHRAKHFNASDAPAMLGVSPYKTRTELLYERHTGIAREVSSVTQALFDAGHRYEHLARALAEKIVGEDLYPVTGSLGELSASFDGLTLDETIAWEHKSINADIRAAKCAADLGEHLRVQMEQQLLVSRADKCLFLASQWDQNGELIEEVHFWYTSDAALRERLVAGWAQFAKDLAEYVPVVHAEKPQAEAIMQLPALSVQIRGEVTLSNLPEFKARAEAFIAGIKTDLVTDEDFVNADETVKFCDKAEKMIDLAKQAAIAQTVSVDEMFRTMDNISDQLRKARLGLEKLVSSRKEQIKTNAVQVGKDAFAKHIAALEAEVTPIRLNISAPDFAGAIKGKRTLASLHDAVNTTLATAKIAADTSARVVRSNLAYLREHAADHLFLFNDQQQIVFKAADDFTMLVSSRVTEHKRKEADRLEAERLRIQEEERAKAVAAAQPQSQPQVSEPVIANHVPATVTTISARKPATPSAPPTLRLGQIGERLGFALTGDFLKTLGFEPAGKDKSAILFHESTFGEICAALMQHIAQVQAKQAA